LSQSACSGDVAIISIANQTKLRFCWSLLVGRECLLASRLSHFHNITLCIPSSYRTLSLYTQRLSVPGRCLALRLGLRLRQFDSDACIRRTGYRKYCRVARMRTGVTVSCLSGCNVTYLQLANSLRASIADVVPVARSEWRNYFRSDHRDRSCALNVESIVRRRNDYTD